MDNNEYFFEWENPIPLNNHSLPTFDTSIFPQWLKEYIEGVAEETQTPIDAPSFGALMMLSTILGGSFIVKPNNTSWKESTILFAVVALDPSNRKSAVFKMLMDPIISFEQEINEKLAPLIKRNEIKTSSITDKLEFKRKLYQKCTDTKEQEELLNEISELQNSIDQFTGEKSLKTIRFYTNDVTPEKLADLLKENNGRYSIISSEGAEFFDMISGRYSNKVNLDIYLKGYSGEGIVIDRKNGTEIRLTHTALSVGIFVQTSVIKNIPQPFLERGLWQRFLFSIPQSNIGYRKIETNAIPHTIKSNFNSNVTELLKLVTHLNESSHYTNTEENKVILEFDDKAKRYLITIQSEIEIMLSNPDLNEAFKGWLGKLVGQIIRIAALLHVAEDVENKNFRDEINLETLKKADSIRQYLIQHAVEAFGIVNNNTNIADLIYLLDKFKSPNYREKDIILHQELWQSVKKKFQKASYLKGLLHTLEEMNYIKVINERKRLIFVNPLIKKANPNYPKFP